MLYLLALFLPPLALLFAGKPFQAIISLIIYIFSWLGLFLFFVPGLLLWFVAVVHAVLVINNTRADRRTEKIVKAMTES